MLTDKGRPFTLRPYQKECVAEAQKRNVLCALPVGSGKTVIAAELIQQTLEREERKKVVFLAPYGELAVQQWRLFLRQIDLLHCGEDGTIREDAQPEELARWRLGLCVGSSSGALESMTTPWWSAFHECQFIVMTPAQACPEFERGIRYPIADPVSPRTALSLRRR